MTAREEEGNNSNLVPYVGASQIRFYGSLGKNEVYLFGLSHWNYPAWIFQGAPTSSTRL